MIPFFYKWQFLSNGTCPNRPPFSGGNMVCIDKVFPNAFLSTKSWKKDEDADITQLSTGKKSFFVSFAWENVGQRLFFWFFILSQTNSDMMAKSDHHVTRNKKWLTRGDTTTHTPFRVCVTALAHPPKKRKEFWTQPKKIKEEKITWESDQKRPDVCAC